ncbi:MAG: membrane protein FxsA [Ahrensia sp.]|nr:membrane protein FxsA [Ahrensia sp.]
MPFALIPFLLLAIPIVEIAAFIVIGGQIGIGWTLLMVLVTAIIGTILLRNQGLQLIEQIRRETDAGRVPAKALGEAAMLLVAGILLLTPGFVTDGIGLLLFAPPVRAAIWRFLAARITVQAGQTQFRFNQEHETSRPFDEGDKVVDLDPDDFQSGPANPDSPWNKNG